MGTNARIADRDRDPRETIITRNAQFLHGIFFSGGFKKKKAEIQIGRGNEKSGNPLKRGDFTGLCKATLKYDYC